MPISFGDICCARFVDIYALARSAFIAACASGLRCITSATTPQVMKDILLHMINAPWRYMPPLDEAPLSLLLALFVIIDGRVMYRPDSNDIMLSFHFPSVSKAYGILSILPHHSSYDAGISPLYSSFSSALRYLIIDDSAWYIDVFFEMAPSMHPIRHFKRLLQRYIAYEGIQLQESRRFFIINSFSVRRLYRFMPFFLGHRLSISAQNYAIFHSSRAR